MIKSIQENYTSLDLEFNQPNPLIIQVGMVVGNIFSGEILERYSAYIKINDPINPYIEHLCHLKQSDVDNGITLTQAYKDMALLHKKHNCAVNPLTWGGGDSLALRNELKLEAPELTDKEWVFGNRWIDVKTLYQERMHALKRSPQAGLAKAMTRVGLAFQGTKHQAPDDALNTFRLRVLLLKELTELHSLKGIK